MAGPLKIRTGNVRVSAPSHASFVLGSRPPALRNPRIKPAVGVTQYGKQLASQSGVPNVSGAGFGDTGQTGES
jgi:hypothetical protein